MTDKPKPFLLDMATLTQEQLDRAMANPGSCKYSGPCILGAMMPQELVDYLASLGSDYCADSNVHDGAAIGHLVTEGLVVCEDIAKARDVQKAFDNLDATAPTRADGFAKGELSSTIRGALEDLRRLLPDLIVRLS